MRSIIAGTVQGVEKVHPQAAREWQPYPNGHWPFPWPTRRPPPAVMEPIIGNLVLRGLQVHPPETNCPSTAGETANGSPHRLTIQRSLRVGPPCRTTSIFGPCGCRRCPPKAQP